MIARLKIILNQITKTNLILKIMIALILAVILGILIPGLAFIPLLGSLFVGVLKAIAPILVFILVLTSLLQANKGIGRKFVTVISLYLLSTLIAALTAVIASFIFPVTMKFTDGVTNNAMPTDLQAILEGMLQNIVQNPITAISEGNYIGILFWAILLGLCLKKLASSTTKNVFNDLASAISEGIRILIQFAPIGIFGLVYNTISEQGLSVFSDYAKLIALLAGCMIFVALIINPIIVFLFIKKNPYPLVFKCIKESGITAFFTRSSAANIPINMELCKSLGLDKDMYSVSIPLGATINMNGAAVTITVMSLAAANTLGIEVTFPMAIVCSIVATFAACGSSGVTGGSLLLIPMACSLFGISNDIAIQVVGVGFIISVIQDSMETALNSSGDVLFTATAELFQRRKNHDN